MNSIYIPILIFLIGIFFPEEGATMEANKGPVESMQKYRQDQEIVKSAEAAVEAGVKNNLISTLSMLGQSTGVLGTNISTAVAVVIRGIVHEGFHLGSVATYIPRLIFLDGPNQFIETLRLIRSNQIRLPQDSDDAIDTLIRFAGSYRDSPIPQGLSPVVSFFPNVFRGVEKFGQTLLYSVFSWLGPQPSPSMIDAVIRGQSLRLGSTPPSPSYNQEADRVSAVNEILRGQNQAIINPPIHINPEVVQVLKPKVAAWVDPFPEVDTANKSPINHLWSNVGMQWANRNKQ